MLIFLFCLHVLVYVSCTVCVCEYGPQWSDTNKCINSLTTAYQLVASLV